jgi:hypothetical protein
MLQKTPTNRAAASGGSVNSLSIKYVGIGDIRLAADVNVRATGTSHGIMKSPPVPCGSFYVWSCDCSVDIPEEYKFVTDTAVPVSVAAELTGTETGGLMYQIVDFGPKNVDVTLLMASKIFGTSFPLPVTVPLPHGLVASGRIANLIRGYGEIALPAPLELRRVYSFVISDVTSKGGSNGYAVEAKAKLVWR